VIVSAFSGAEKIWPPAKESPLIQNKVYDPAFFCHWQTPRRTPDAYAQRKRLKYCSKKNLTYPLLH
jgi:hypothetical protein